MIPNEGIPSMEEAHGRFLHDDREEIRIKGLNVDKSRKDTGSTTVYHLYFELSHHPMMEWNCQFGVAWKKICPAYKVEIDRGFLVLHSELHEVSGKLLPLLKLAVGEANAAYRRYVIQAASDRKERERVWLDERSDIEALAAALRFD